MEFRSSAIAGALLLAALAYQLWRLLQIGRRPSDYPPGPPTVPILGNIHLVRKTRGILRSVRVW